jgi:hypothetical protein
LLIVRLVRRRRQRRGLHRRHRRLQLRRRLHIRRRRGGPSTPEKSEPNAPLVGAPH